MNRNPALTLLTASLMLAFNVAPASAQTSPALTLKRVSLSSSGVGYFEYEAQVRGKATLSLPVGLDTVDDVLKSLVIYDAQGSIGGVSLPGLDPIAQTLKQLPFDAAALNRPAALLEALRGAEISVGPNGATKQPSLRGRIVSVLPIAATDKDPAKHQVMLMTPQGMQQFVLETAENLQFEDPVLRDQIAKALAALSNNRAKDARTIDIISEGKPNDPSLRTVRVGYVSTVPIWKNAYRLTLPQALPSVVQAQAQAQVQGWAVIENMSGQDWNGVQLTLTAGKPIAFSQQLYRSYYNTRPQIGIELPGNIVPTADAGTFWENGKDGVGKNEQAPMVVGNKLASQRPAAAPASMARSVIGNMSLATASGVGFSGEVSLGADSQKMPTQVAQAYDTAAVQDDSTQTSYTFGLPVTVGSGRSLSIPIIQNELPMARVALYQPNVNAQHPLAAIELANTTANGMPAGAATLYEATSVGNQFVGDAQLSVLPASDKRYVSYALDQKVSIAQRHENTSKLKSYRINGAHLMTEHAREQASVFTIKSTHAAPRDVVVEVPVLGAGWELQTSTAHSAIGKTATAYRRNIAAAPHTSSVVDVRQTHNSVNIQPLVNFNPQQLRDIAKTPEFDAASKPLLDAVLALMEARNALNQQAAALDKQLRDVRENQNRIRDNLKAVPVKSEPHTRYMAELNTADAQDAQLQTQLSEATRKKLAAETALKDYLGKL